jgi:membrane-associated phospholipid phosphatase
MRASRWVVGVLMGVVVAVPAMATAQGASGTEKTTGETAPPPPPPPPPPPLFSGGDAWIAGGFAAATLIAMPFDERLAEWMQQPSRQNNSAMKGTATVFRNFADPGTVVIAGGVYIAGVLEHNATMTDVGFHSGEAIVASSVVGWAIKSVAGRARPRVDIHRPHDFKLGRGFGAAGDYQSFPSGHTLAAFSLAAAVTAESDRLWPEHHALIGVLTYGGATLSGLSRMYNNAHWASDVLLGAGIGTLSGLAIIHFNEAHPRNLINRVLLGASVLPDGQGGLVVAWTIPTR